MPEGKDRNGRLDFSGKSGSGMIMNGSLVPEEQRQMYDKDSVRKSKSMQLPFKTNILDIELIGRGAS